jgi:hypothetical protein
VNPPLGACVAVGIWGLFIAWLLWEVWHAPVIDVERQLEQERRLELIWLEQCWDAEAYDWRRS